MKHMIFQFSRFSVLFQNKLLSALLKVLLVNKTLYAVLILRGCFFSDIMAMSKFEVQEPIQSKVINDFRFGALL